MNSAVLEAVARNTRLLKTRTLFTVRVDFKRTDDGRDALGRQR